VSAVIEIERLSARACSPKILAKRSPASVIYVVRNLSERGTPMLEGLIGLIGLIGFIVVLLLISSIAGAAARSARNTRRVPCATCGEPLLLAAETCPNCHARVATGLREWLWRFSRGLM
jgi:hypothetical protein